ncbi:sulfotransferase domain-containing protein [Actinoplanes sp. NPDC051851]|uniref:sulfotransferase domain-containing protein n=1 Tax=Actinoplanes sp. NPDC051851 TaxID=3154753 RepID=UPI003418A153
MTTTVRYRNPRQDSARWDALNLRPDDIVVTAPIKSGTTWLQTICALLIFRTAELPERLGELSPWVDATFTPIETVRERLDGQRHRRILKTHTPLDGLPEKTGLRYVAGARDPLDVAVSFYHQTRNLDAVALSRLLSVDVPEPVLPPLPDWVAAWAGERVDDVHGRNETLQGVLHHVTRSWERRTRPDVLLVHYADLVADLDGGMRRIATHLGITIPEDAWPGLVEAASFSRVKERADVFAPVGPLRDRAAFFHRGVNGSGSEVLGESGLESYRKRLLGLAKPDLVEWLRGGSASIPEWIGAHL